MKKFLLRSLAVVLVLIVLVGAYLGSVVWRVNHAEPEWTGQLKLPGLRAPVRILRNEHGVPHIFAENQHDLLFAQGFVHAQDYFGLMSLQRQIARGELSSWLGALGLAADKRARTLGLAHGAEAAWPELPEATRAFVQAYSDGVNAWLTSDHYRKPAELIALHVSPEPWRPTDSLAMMRLLHAGFASDGDELLRARLERSEADNLIQRMFFANEWPVFPVIDEPDGGTVPQSTQTLKTKAFSNSWVLSGAHTVSGQPLLANDPHLGSVIPAVFAIQRLSGGAIEAAGGTLPGIPGVLFGHNGAVAWGVTSSLTDTVDYVLLEVDPDDPGRYRRGPDAPWARFSERTETIEVRFGEPQSLTVRTTPMGTAWPDELLGEPFPAEGLLERRQPALTMTDTSAETFHRLLTTQTVQETTAAFAQAAGPNMNVLMADTAGNIGYLSTGQLTRRPASRAISVDFAPVDSNESELARSDENPQVINPASGRIISGNQRTVGDDFPFYLSQRWTSPDRAMRIHELLNARDRHDPESTLAMQLDVLSPIARRLLPVFLDRMDAEASVLQGIDPGLLAALRDWDYRFVPEALAPTLFMTWIAEINRRMLLDESAGVDVGLNPEFLQMDYHTAGMVLRDGPETWCDDRETAAVEDCATLLAIALAAAQDKLVEGLGPDPAGWDWGTASETTFRHPLAALPLVGGAFSVTEPVPGGPGALFNHFPDLTRAPRFDFAYTLPQYRGIYDLSNLDESVFIQVGGTTGYPGSAFYDNLFDEWRNGEVMTLPPAPGAVDVRFELVLEP